MLPLGKLRVTDPGHVSQDSTFTPDERQTVDRHSSGNRQVYDRDNIRVWTAGEYVAVFNLKEQSKDVRVAWGEHRSKPSELEGSGSVGAPRPGFEVSAFW
jgi:hypothetical protein